MMRAATAAGYCNERSVNAFRKRVGKIYPKPHYVPGRGLIWLREELDEKIDRLTNSLKNTAEDLASDL